MAELLRCPHCVAREQDGDSQCGHLTCHGDLWLLAPCGRKYPILDGIPVLLIEEGEKWMAIEPRHLPHPHPHGNAAHTQGTSDADLDLSIILPALNEGANLEVLLPKLCAVLSELDISYEILVVTLEADTPTVRAAGKCGARVITQQLRGYGGALQTGFQEARGTYLLTMDADLSHQPTFVRDLWQRRHRGEVQIASRFMPGGSARMPLHRYLLSRLLNIFFSRGLSLSVRDMSSGFRLLKADAVKNIPLAALDFDIVQEILVRAFAEGWSVQETPMQYEPRAEGTSHARILPFGIAYLRTFWSLWKLRNSILAADYDDRAYDSPIPLQRYWQRMRFKHVTDLIANEGPVLDVGCGSSRIIGALPAGSVAADVLLRKLRYARKFGTALVQASGFHLPFPDEFFPCVLCSQVIEHVPKDSRMLDELCRVLKPGGRLVLGTPDYASWAWVVLEKLYGSLFPGGYADEHIAHYTHDELVSLFRQRGFIPEENRYILRGELILAFRKPAASLSGA